VTLLEKHNLRKGLLFVSPWIIGFCVFIAYPFVCSIYYSFCYYSGLDSPHFIGLLNYKNLFTDPVFWKSLWNTFYYVGFAIPLGFLVTFPLAVLLNTKVRGRAFFRAIFYIPSLVPIVAGAILWAWIFNGKFGLLNDFLITIGVPNPPNWLADPAYAKAAIIIMSLWGLGNAVVIYLAGLQDVPASLYEAAEIDGANWFDKMIHITLPMLSPVVMFNVVMGIITAFQIFAQPYIMTQGGPQRATTFYTLYLYQLAFEDFRMGYASAMAWILLLIILGLTLLVIKAMTSRVYYRGG